MNKEKLKRGILLIANGHSNYYHMAVVLAASIRCNDGLPVCLVTNHAIHERHQHLFDVVIEPSKKSITQKYGKVEKTEYIKAKLFMYDYSPFEETIFLDVDQVMISGRNLSSIFEELKDIDLAFSNTGIAEMSIWSSIDEVKKLYGNKPYWNYHSELVYFKKSPSVKSYFEAAKKVYEDNKIKSAVKFSAAAMADELAFQCAAMITGMYPHKENWTPNFWYDRATGLEKQKYPYQLSGYITYSIGGNQIPQRVKDNYNILAKHYFAKLGLSNPYQVEDKRNFLPERNLI